MFKFRKNLGAVTAFLDRFSPIERGREGVVMVVRK